MTKTELVNALALKTGSTKTDAGRFLEAMGDIVTSELKSGAEVILPNIGKLVAVQKAARQGRNPRTGVTAIIPAKKAVKFKVTSVLQAAIQ